MADAKTERSNCRFSVHSSFDGKPQIRVQLYHQTISRLKNAEIGFDLLGGTAAGQAKKIAELLNENVLDVFVTFTDAAPEQVY